MQSRRELRKHNNRNNLIRETMNQLSIIAAEDLQKIDPKTSIILDVRTDMEHAEKHIAQEHIHIPLDQLDAQSLIVEKGLSPDTCIYLFMYTIFFSCTYTVTT